ncbi:fibronectin type III domain-containing protein [Cohnella herbarum]|uniref:Fibronectin type III domain-containing protein n=1 Tax=Cohnella herbarum TaxID=2728023 RepID=A0A7Z2ZN89_9BACL|nr:fibronectin type III domain-containing protein [Cohnella herbarum]QJD85849.1 fibronectin type III domain-containing protein [Cohnella herbarum]
MSYQKVLPVLLISFFLIIPLNGKSSYASEQTANMTAAIAAGSAELEEKTSRQELVEKRTANTKQYLLGDGTQQTVITLEPQHYVDQNGQWQDIVPALIDEAEIQDMNAPMSREVVSEVKQISKKNKELKRLKVINQDDTSYKALQVPFDISLPMYFHKGYSIKKEQDQLYFKPVGASNKAKAKRTDKQTLIYEDVWASTDVTLQLLGEGVKETFILKDKNAPLTFSFEVEGEISSGLTRDQLHILPASLIDANGTVRSVDQNSRKQGNKQYIDITVDDSGLIYPIEVDPTVSLSPSLYAYRIVQAFGASDLYYNSPSSIVFVGGRAWNHGYISYLNFDLSSIDGIVSSASLSLYRTNSNSGDNRPLLIESYMNSSPWSSANPSQIPGRGELISAVNTPANNNAPVVFTGMEKYIRQVIAGNGNFGIELFPVLTDEKNQTLRHFLSPTLTINYTPIPKVTEVVAPVVNQFFGPNDNSFIPTIKVTGPNASPLTVAYYLDSEASPRETKSVSNPQTAQTVSFSAMNIGALAEGKHTFRFTASNGQQTGQKSVDVYVDKTLPSLGSVSVTSTGNSVSISGSASDGGSGLDVSPYRYTVGAVTSGWTSQTSYSVASLMPNTVYQVKFEARDKVGLVSLREQQIYTTAQNPTLSVTRSMENGLELSVNDSNPAGTKYVIQAGSQYVNATGALTASPVWFAPVNKKITVTGLTTNTSYVLTIKARNEAGVETSSSAAISGTTLAAPPVTITPVAEQRSIRLSWPAISGATGYDIEVDSTIISNGVSAAYVHNNLAPNTPHKYRVRVINAGGTGNWSTLVSINTLPNPPSIPLNIHTTSTQTDVTVTWDASTGADGYDIEADGKVIDNGNQLSYVAKDLLPLTKHTYRVRAKNAGGTSEWSNAVTQVTLPYPPTAPKQLAAQPTIHQITVNWDPVAGADSYEIEADGAILDNGTRTTYTHDGLDPLSGHTYRVRAVNAGGKSPWSSTLYATTHPEKPDIPTNIMMTADGTAISLIWYEVSHAESYDIEINGTTITNTTSAQFIHTELSPDSRHKYRIRAVNISGKSEWSSSVTMRTLPSQSDANDFLTNLAAVVTNSSITLSWDTVAPDAEYEIEVDGVIMDNGSSTIYQQTGLPPNEYHTYKIRLKQSGSSGVWVAMLSLSTLPNPPDAPGQLEGFPTNNSIELKWGRVEGATGYDIEIDGKTVGGSNNTTYLDEGLSPGTTHTYRVRAKNMTGVTAWSPALVTSTTNPDYRVEVVQGQVFHFSLLAFDVKDFSERKFIVMYNPDELEVIDLYSFTPKQDALSTGTIPGSPLSVTNVPGTIEFRVHQSVAPGTVWSGEITSIVFKSKIDGQSFINFRAE